MRRSVGISPFQLAVTACTLGALLATAAVATATPSTPRIEEKRREAAAVERRLDDLAAELELRTEEYQEVADALDSTRERIALTRADLERAEAQLEQAQDLLTNRAERIYRNEGVGFLDVLFGVRSFGQFLTALDFMRQVARSDASAVTAVQSAVAAVERAERMLEAREAEQAVLREKARAKHAEVKRAFTRQRSYLSSVNAEVARLVREERARQARIAAERARRAAIAAAAAAARRRTVSAASERHFDPGTLGGGHPEAVGVALKYLGVPYVWGGSTPGQGFDCSGLTQYVYAEIGVELPRNSRSQFASGSYIPADRLDLLRAGDLVFFGFGGDPAQVHHVGVYVGDGSFIHAPQTGERVQASSLAGRIASRADYVGACRY